MAWADTLNTILGTAERIAPVAADIYTAYAGSRGGRRARAAPVDGFDPSMAGFNVAPAGFAPGFAPAVYSPSAVPANWQSLLQNLVDPTSPAGALMLPPRGSSSPVILRPGDTVSGSLFAERTVARTPSFFAVEGPNGQLRWFRSAGKPILWSGDLGACKRVNRVAARARARMGGARRRSSFRKRR